MCKKMHLCCSLGDEKSRKVMIPKERRKMIHFHISCLFRKPEKKAKEYCAEALHTLHTLHEAQALQDETLFCLR